MKVIKIMWDELIDQSNFGAAFILAGTAIPIAIALATGSGWLSAVSGLSGILAVVLCAQRKLVSFPLSFLQMFTYVALAWRQNFYGELAENAFYFVTMLFGMFSWSRNYDSEDGCVRVRAMSAYGNVACALFNAAAIYVLFIILRGTDDTQPFLDAVSTVPAFTAQILMMLRYRENWIYWLTIDIASVFMWITAGDWVMAAQFVFWTVNCIYGFFRWSSTTTNKTDIA